MTLAELLIVLVILGVLATVAVQSMQPVMDQARFEATQRTLENVRAGIVGSASGVSTSDAVTGFVADTGKLPKWNELIAESTVTTMIQARKPFNNLLIPSVERGPYLRLPIGSTPQTSLVNGWGQEIEYPSDATTGLTLSTTPPNQKDPMIMSLSFFDWHAKQLSVNVYSLNPNDLNRRIHPPRANWQIHFCSPGTEDRLFQIDTSDEETPAAVSYQISANIDDRFLLTIGPRIVYVTKGTSPDADAVAGQIVTLRPGATHVVDLLVE